MASSRARYQCIADPSNAQGKTCCTVATLEAKRTVVLKCITDLEHDTEKVNKAKETRHAFNLLHCQQYKKSKCTTVIGLPGGNQHLGRALV